MAPWLDSHQNDLWVLRQRLCGNAECAGEQECTLYQRRKDGSASLYQKDVQYALTNCWVCTPRSSFAVFLLQLNWPNLWQEATDNIITECSRNHWKNGWWQSGDEFYEVCFPFTTTVVLHRNTESSCQIFRSVGRSTKILAWKWYKIIGIQGRKGLLVDLEKLRLSYSMILNHKIVKETLVDSWITTFKSSQYLILLFFQSGANSFALLISSSKVAP